VDYDFNVCKLCGRPSGRVTYFLADCSIYVCAECRFHYTDHLDSAETAGRPVDSSILTEEVVEYIENGLHANVDRFDAHVSELNSVLQLEGARVLDVGCGGGKFLSLLASAGANSRGIELSDFRVAYARSRLGVSVDNYPVEHDFWQLHHREEFDAVTLWDVIEHVNFPVETIGAISRLLRPGGFLLMDTPCRESLFHQLGVAEYRATWGRRHVLLSSLYSGADFAHKQILSHGDIRSVIEAAGLTIRSIRNVAELSFPLESYLRRAVSSDAIVKVLTPLVRLVRPVVRVRNKMIVNACKLR
jgi:2-polyprenyl-6-hydroxyphenyl methylase/3-demethylubiquinone-9 3-methyltransferase